MSLDTSRLEKAMDVAVEMQRLQTITPSDHFDTIINIAREIPAPNTYTPRILNAVMALKQENHPIKLSAKELLDEIFETVFATSCQGNINVSPATYRKLVRETNAVLFAWKQCGKND